MAFPRVPWPPQSPQASVTVGHHCRMCSDPASPSPHSGQVSYLPEVQTAGSAALGAAATAMQSARQRSLGCLIASRRRSL
eukprot:140924-Lingulodinium_polyedra.AAC.1